MLINEKNKKRIFTYVPLVTRIEEVLITQSVWKEKTQQSLLKLKSLQTVYNLGHQFISNSNKHWSLFETAKQ